MILKIFGIRSLIYSLQIGAMAVYISLRIFWRGSTNVRNIMPGDFIDFNNIYIIERLTCFLSLCLSVRLSVCLSLSLSLSLSVCVCVCVCVDYIGKTGNIRRCNVRKRTFGDERPVKISISLRIRAV